jgi:hypothetical protein
MIKVVRPKGSTPEGLIRKGLAELKKHRNLEPKAREFKAYSADPVKEKLAELFGRKCMFCESLLAGTQPGDVEHYRPKGKVVVYPKTAHAPAHVVPGYYWLGAKWPNLLLSCADCNRPRTQDDFDGNARVIGKANFFPLADEAKRATGPWLVLREEPLLLNPCVDDPADHLVFLEDGRVEPRLIGGVPSPKGRASIHYLGLARAELLQMRARHGRMVLAAIRHTVAAFEGGREPGADLEDLVSFLDPKEAYVAFSRMLIHKHMRNYIADLGLPI